VALVIYGLLRLQTLRANGAVDVLRDPGYEGWMFLLEMTLGVLLPVALLAFHRVRTSERGLVIAGFLAILGLVVNRLNVSVTGMEAAAGVRYVPSWMEVTVSVGLVALGMIAFAAAVRYLPIFTSETAASQRRPAARYAGG